MNSTVSCEMPARESQEPAVPAESRPVPGPERVLRVAYMDLWCFIPYYMAALTTAMAGQKIDSRLLSSSYRFDPGYFERLGLVNNPGLLDFVSRQKIGSAGLRRWLKLAEYCANLLIFTFKLLLAPPDIIHAQYLALLSRGLPLELWALRIAKWRGVRLACTVHNVLPHDTGDRYRPGFARLYRMADLLICHNRAACRRIEQEFGISRERIAVIPHGPLQQLKDSMSPEAARAALNLPQDKVIVLWQGVIAPYKGIEFLLDTWKTISPGALLLIAGTGEEQLLAQIRSKVAGPGLDAVRLDFGFIPPEKLPAYYQAADVLVYPYSNITTSGALLTGLGYGKPIAATRLPAFEEMFSEGEDALLVDYGDTGALAAALQSLIDRKPLRDRLGAAAKRLAETTYSWEQIAAETRRAYDEVLTQPMAKIKSFTTESRRH